nr:LuxR family transcriptional regulator [uncultured Actinoplanes sp.]
MATPLTGREPERAVLDRFLEAVGSARGQALVIRGEPGVGKTTLLGYLADRARGFRVVQVTGVRPRMHLAYAALHQLCAPLLDRLPRLPMPQREALRTALGLGSGPAPDRFLVGLAVLTLLSEVAAKRPLVCLIDDEQWLDRASARVLGFVARRLTADPVGLVFAARAPGGEIDGLPELPVAGLPPPDARALLESAMPVPLDDRARDLVVAEAQGNPLALLELPRALAPAHLAGGFGLPPAACEASFRQRLDDLPAVTRRLLQLAAIDSSGDPVRIHRAATRLGIPLQAAQPAVESGLIEFGGEVHFRHPLVRSAAYDSASPRARREIHRVLAEVSNPIEDPDRRAWHRAHAAPGPDEAVAGELERAAGRAQARGGPAAAAAFLERSVHLSADPVRRAGRALAAARATLAAGAFARALDLLDIADAGAPTELAAAHADLLRAQISFFSGLGDAAPPMLVKAAGRLVPLDLDLARETYMNAWTAASFAGRMVGAGSMEEIAHAVRDLPPARHPRPLDLLLDALAQVFIEDRAAAGPALRRVARLFAEGELSREDGIAFGWTAAALVWDDAAAHAIQQRNVRLARAAGALDHLPLALLALALSETWRGDFAAAAARIAETEGIREITGSRIVAYPALFLAALRGDPAEMLPLVQASRAAAQAEGQGAATTYVHWVTAVFENGHGRHAAALDAARRATEDDHLLVSMWALPELIEAAVREGEIAVAARGLARLATTTRGGTDFGLGLQARSRALLSGEDHFGEAAERLERAGIRTELARTHLLHGEWLRRAGRLAEARDRLRTAHEMLAGLGMTAFTERARRELLAAGETVRRRTSRAGAALTPREALVARLAADGMTNGEIGTRLFLSSRTVEWHLRKTFGKLGIASRQELHHALSSLP